MFTDSKAHLVIDTLPNENIPEFYQLLNNLIRTHIDLLDGDLGYIAAHYPSLLDVDSKLRVARKACLQIDEDAKSDLDKFPLLRGEGSYNISPSLEMKLTRGNAWSDPK